MNVPVTLAALALTMLATAQTALGCAGLIGPNGAVNLLRTTTFAGYHGGAEHYVTAFSFAGGSGRFGSLIPLPGIPSKVERGGDWTLQRLVRETTPQVRGAVALAAADSAKSVEVLQQVRIDALDVSILRGGGPEVGRWATEHGFRLPADAPEVLDFYAARSPIFMAAVFDADAAKARGQRIGDGTPVHLTIPTANPWVPLRILALGKAPGDRVDADVFLLTDRRPGLLPVPGANGLVVRHDAAATALLLDDLRGDKGMEWIPESAWLTKLAVSATAGQLGYDLAIDGQGRTPSRVAAGLAGPAPANDDQVALGLAALALASIAGFVLLRRPAAPVPE